MSHKKDFDHLVAMEHAVRALAQVRENKHSQIDVGRSKDDITAKIKQLISVIYEENHSDSSQFAKPQKDGVFFSVESLPPADGQRLLHAIEQFVHRAYDDQGHVKLSQQEVPAVLEQLYTELSAVPLNNMNYVAGVMLQHLGESEKWKEVLPYGVDFTRAVPGDSLTDRFQKACGPSQKVETHSPFINHSESMVSVAGHEFPVVKLEGWRTHLVTESGTLYDLTDELKQRLKTHLQSGRHIDDFVLPPVTEDHFHLAQMVRPRPGMDAAARQRMSELRSRLEGMQEARQIDGKPVDVQAPHLLCLDTDLLTGLYLNGKKPSELQQFKGLCNRSGVIRPDALGMSDFIGFMPEEKDSAHQTPETICQNIREKFAVLKEKAGDDLQLQAIVGRAEKHMLAVAPRIWESVEKAFRKEDGSPKEPPTDRKKHFYMTQGGMGSGKSYSERIAKQECGDNLVVAGLDGVRSESQQYDLYLGTDNHNNDYKKLEEFGKLIRAMTIRRAMHEGLDLLLDGTGIPYRSRYQPILAKFKEADYHTSVLAADVYLYVNDPPKRAELALQGKTFDDALFRGGARLTKAGRAVPLGPVSDSHFRAPEAIMNAARDKDVDRFRLMDTAPAQNDAYTLSYVVNIDDLQLHKLRNTPTTQLRQTLQGEGLVPADVVLPKQDEFYDFKIVRNLGENRYMMQVITDLERYLGFVQKGLYNRNVSTQLQNRELVGPEDYTRNTLSFDVEGDFQGPDGKLGTVPAKGVQVVDWPHYAKVIT